MALRHAIIHAFDRPGGRLLLSTLASWYARKMTGKDVCVIYDGFWLHRIGTDYIADYPEFNYSRTTMLNWEISYREIFEHARDFWFYAYKPEPGHVILDVGAGAGLETLAFSRSVGERGKVIAIEAHPVTFNALKILCKWNHLDNTAPHHIAIMHEPCQVYIEDLAQHEENTVGLFSEPVRMQRAINGISIDEFCEKHSIHHVDYLKMNIEGAERFAISGMKETIRKIDHVCIACHDFRADNGHGEHFRTRDLVVDFLCINNFKVITRDRDSRPYVRDHIYGVRKS